MVALLVVEAGLFAAMELALWPALAGLGVVLIALVLRLGALKASTSGVEELSEAVLDERQWQLRGRVLATSHRLGAFLLTVGLAVVALWLVVDLPDPGYGVTAGASARAAPPHRNRASHPRRRHPSQPLNAGPG